MERHPTRWWGPFRQEWYSICSVHFVHRPTCRMCQAGQWMFVHVRPVESYIFKRWPGLWRAWANRRWFNGSRAFLEKHFPNLRRK